MSSVHNDGAFAGVDDARIYFQYWRPAAVPRALMVLVHGAGEHSGRYSHFVEYVTARGYAVAALDHPGHGRSAGRPGYIARFNIYLDTLRRFHRQVSADFNGIPQILVGHSMGGLISCHYLLQHQAAFAGCVLSGPAILSDLKPGIWQLGIARVLSTVLPRVGVLKIDSSGISRDPDEVRKYRDDPLVYQGPVCARVLVELIDAMERIRSLAPRIHLPLLLLHGGRDDLTSPQGSRFLYEHVGSAEKSLHIYPGLYHEVFNEPERAQVYADFSSWCDALLTHAGAASTTPF